MELLKPDNFNSMEEAQSSFKNLKKKMITSLILKLTDVNKVFQVHCDASNLGIGTGLSQEGQPIAYFSEKLNEVPWRYSTYDKEF